ncbi:MAG TPA: 2-C-methyl-D-erythritol 2,4-cyclodiphosphate synthase [Clostridiales bacterium]|nr:2-C-methyl-D-erythritol 2,4-cyclodiphosphate synthase [Eubacteriales bacterium]HBR31637.1 2-C-methyl-D-erythritol 2,4-cyclodiphosphate synthase [Clostridiales bacterium]
MKKFRIGHGYDVHRLVPDRSLILGGVDIPHESGLAGHSDADVLLHAICDALLGAAAMRDIGFHFPNSDIGYKNISSLVLLEKVRELLEKRGYVICNIDATVIAQEPKLSPFIPDMTQNISAVLGIPLNDVNIKATTEESMGFTGQKLGIAAHAVTLIQEI